MQHTKKHTTKARGPSFPMTSMAWRLASKNGTNLSHDLIAHDGNPSSIHQQRDSPNTYLVNSSSFRKLHLISPSNTVTPKKWMLTLTGQAGRSPTKRQASQSCSHITASEIHWRPAPGNPGGWAETDSERSL